MSTPKEIQVWTHGHFLLIRAGWIVDMQNLSLIKSLETISFFFQGLLQCEYLQSPFFKQSWGKCFCKTHFHDVCEDYFKINDQASVDISL